MHNDQPMQRCFSPSQESRRAFLASGVMLGAAALAGSPTPARAQGSAKARQTFPFELPPLGYAAGALEPFIDAETMEVHHGKHHASYVKNLNGALEGHKGLQNLTVEELLKDLAKVPEEIRVAVRNNAGGHANHTLFWQILKKTSGAAPTGALAKRIDADFGSFDKFKTAFQDAGAKLFGSGWVFVFADAADGGKLKIRPMPNQDSLHLAGLAPLFGNDVWEHAYYLKYQNRRPDYLAAWWNVVDWEQVGARYASQSAKS